MDRTYEDKTIYILMKKDINFGRRRKILEIYIFHHNMQQLCIGMAILPIKNSEHTVEIQIQIISDL